MIICKQFFTLSLFFMAKDDTFIRVKKDTQKNLKTLEIKVSWIDASSYDQKINHLMWFFESYSKKNGK